ncbi:cytidine deaminase-like fold-containing protein, partial [Saccharibacter floricola]
SSVNALNGAAAASAIQQYNQANEDQDTEEERRGTEEQRANGRDFLNKTAWAPVLAGPSDLGLAVIDGAEGHYSDVAQDVLGMAMDLSLPFSLAAPVEKVVLFGGEEIGLDFFLDRKYSPLRGDPREIPQERLPEGTREENLRVFAEGKIGDTILRDVNQTARNPEGFDEDAETALFDIVREKHLKQEKKATNPDKKFPNGTAGSAHAEIGLLQQALDKGLADGAHLDMTVYGEPICPYCRSDISKMADRVGLSSMRVRSFSEKDRIDYEVFHYWKPGTKLKENKSMRTILGPSKEK